MDVGKYEVWKSHYYHKDSVGYYKDVVKDFRVYYSEDDVLVEYNKQKNFCDTDEKYMKFKFGFEYDLFF